MTGAHLAAGPVLEESHTIEVVLGFLAASLGFAAASAAGAGPSLLRRVTRQQVVGLVAVVAAVTAALALTASATGTPVVDAAYRAVLVGVVTYLGSRLRLLVLVGAAAAAAALSAGQGGAALGALAAAGALMAHTIEGSCATFAAAAMASLCDDLEAASARADHQSVEATLAKLDGQFEHVDATLRAAFRL